MAAMKHSWMVGLLVLGGCGSEAEVTEPAAPIEEAAAAMPEIRYYMIADT